MKNNRKIQALITGGAGFIGSHLAEELIKKNYSVTILDNLSNLPNPYRPYSGVGQTYYYLGGCSTERREANRPHGYQERFFLHQH